MEALVKLRPNFVEYLNNVEGILDHLFSQCIFTHSDMSSVSCHRTRRDQVRELLNILSRKLPSNLNKFYEILLLTDNQLLADEIARFTPSGNFPLTPSGNFPLTSSGKPLMPTENLPYPIQEEGNFHGYVVSIDGYIQEEYFKTFITNYTRNIYINSKSVLITDFPSFLYKEIKEMSRKWLKYNFALYLVMCDSELNAIVDEDYIKQIVTISEIIFSDNPKHPPMMCLICCGNNTIEERHICTDNFLVAALQKDHFRNLLNNIPGDLSSVYTYVKNFVSLTT